MSRREDRPHVDVAVVAAAAQLRRRADAEARRAVSEARAAGASWSDVARALGTSRQAAAKRYGRP